MELTIKSLTNTEAGKKKLPKQFGEEYRPDLIKKSVIILQSHTIQPYGASPMAGKRASAELSRRRRKYRGSYGIGISRVPRKILTRRGTRMNWVGAFAPGTVGGRRAHPPKSSKLWSLKMNKKENRKAIRSALSATLLTDLAKARGHKVPEAYPFIIEDKIESLNKTKQVKDALKTIGFSAELERSSEKKVRAGRGKTRGRKYKKKIGLLIVVADDCNLAKAGKNIPGVDIVKVKDLNAEILAPGTDAGRLSIFTNKALEIMEKEKLFM